MPTCYVIGQTSLALRCAQKLIEKGHQILGAIGPNENLKNWAEASQIPYFQTVAQFEQNTIQEVDYIFSIVNASILSAKLLALAKIYAVNFHDALLPRYAGVNATTWALLNGENRHGITWHIMTAELDAGDILQQAPVLITEEDTALTLNLKCYEQAFSSFCDLLEQFNSNSSVRKNQDLSLRTYYGRAALLPNVGFIDWHWPAAYIDRFCRALNLGTHINSLGLPKIVTNKKVYILTKLKISNISSTEPAGTIVKINADNIIIATGSFNIHIYELLTAENTIISAAKCIVDNNLEAGDLLQCPAKNYLDVAQIKLKELLSSEHYWVTALQKISRLALPFATTNDFSVDDQPYCFESILNKELLQKITAQFAGYSVNEILLTALLVYLYFINNAETFSVQFKLNDIENCFSVLKNWLHDYVPFTPNLVNNISFNEAASIVKQHILLVKKHQTYTFDMPQRYFLIEKQTQFKKLLLSINLDGNFTGSDFSTKININVNATGYRLQAKLTKEEQTLKVVLSHLLDQVKELLIAAVAAPEKPISILPLITAENSQQLLIDWNQTQVNYPRYKAIHQFVEAHAQKTPHAIAAIYNNQSLTYYELNHQANQLADFLITKGVSTDIPVAICLERSFEFLIAVIGVYKAGGGYVPLNPSNPSDRLLFMLEDCKAPLVLTKQEHIPALEKYQGIIFTFEEMAAIKNNNEQTITRENQTGNLAYIVYTSGSTGKPKGVITHHQNAINYCQDFIKRFHITQQSVFDFSMATTFDASIIGFWVPLVAGATVVIADHEIKNDPVLYLNYLNENKINFIFVTPSYLKQMLACLPNSENGALIHLSHPIVGGEILFKNLIQQWFDVNPTHQIINIYGPTETTVNISTFIVRPSDIQQINTVSIPIGKPISNHRFYVLDAWLRPCPIGVEGELYISGAGVAEGYLNMPALTAERFCKNIFNTDEHEQHRVMYKTGDLVRYLPDGNIEYLRRADGQIKLRGFRIECAEIEKILGEQAQIAAAAVTTFEHNGDTQLIAYLIHQAGNPLAEHLKSSCLANLQKNLKKLLPDYMMPSQYIFVDKFPLDGNGKLNYRLLPKPSEQFYYDNIVPARNDIEKLLADMLSELLSNRPVGIQHNFFEIGMHSLLIIQFVNKAKQTGINFSVKDAYQNPTIEKLALIAKYDKENIAKNSKQFASETILSSSHTVKNKWQLLRYNPLFQWSRYVYSGVDNCCFGIELPGNFSHAALETILNYILNKHPNLKTTVSTWYPLQKFNLAAQFKLNSLDISAMAPAEQVQYKNRLIRKFHQQNILKNDSGLCFDAILIGLNKNIAELYAFVPHINFDETSAYLFFEEFENAYRNWHANVELEVDPNPLPYIEAALAEREQIDPLLKDYTQFWAAYIQDVQPFKLVELIVPHAKVKQSMLELSIPWQNFVKFKKLSSQLNISIAAVFIGILNITLFKLDQQKTHIIAYMDSGRDDEKTTKAIGSYARYNLIKTHKEVPTRFTALLKNIQDEMLNMMAYRNCPEEMTIWFHDQVTYNKSTINIRLWWVSRLLVFVFKKAKINRVILDIMLKQARKLAYETLMNKLRKINIFKQNKIAAIARPLKVILNISSSVINEANNEANNSAFNFISPFNVIETIVHENEHYEDAECQAIFYINKLEDKLSITLRTNLNKQNGQLMLDTFASLCKALADNPQMTIAEMLDGAEHRTKSDKELILDE